MAFGNSGINGIVNAITSGLRITVFGELTISGLRRFKADMCSRIVTLVFFVILHILTVKNLHRVSTGVHAHRLVRDHAP